MERRCSWRSGCECWTSTSICEASWSVSQGAGDGRRLRVKVLSTWMRPHFALMMLGEGLEGLGKAEVAAAFSSEALEETSRTGLRYRLYEWLPEV